MRWITPSANPPSALQSVRPHYAFCSAGQIFIAMSATSISSCREAPPLACTAMPVATHIACQRFCIPARRQFGGGDAHCRLTLGLRRIDGAWKVTHEHYAIPIKLDYCRRTSGQRRPGRAATAFPEQLCAAAIAPSASTASRRTFVTIAKRPSSAVRRAKLCD